VQKWPISVQTGDPAEGLGGVGLAVAAIGGQFGAKRPSGWLI
jgi:hypothetical protein